MSDQDTRILPRLYAMLETVDLDNAREVANIVGQIRRIKGAKAFTGGSSLASEEISLALDDRNFEVRLRSVAIMLSRVSHRRPDVAQAMSRVQTAFTAPGGKVQRKDLLTLIVVMKDLIDLRASADPVTQAWENLRRGTNSEAVNAAARQQADAFANAEQIREFTRQAEFLRTAMEELRRSTTMTGVWP